MKVIKNNVDGFIKYTNSKRDMIHLIKKVLKNYQYYSKNCLLRSREYDVDKLCKSFWKYIKN